MNENEEWQMDETGRRFRKVGNIREYEQIIRVNGCDIPVSELPDYHAQNNENKGVKYVTPAAVKRCPFNSTAMDPRCRQSACAWWRDGCAAVQHETNPSGGLCPVSRGFVMRCSVSCVAYNNGCMLVEKPEKT